MQKMSTQSSKRHQNNKKRERINNSTNVYENNVILVDEIAKLFS